MLNRLEKRLKANGECIRISDLAKIIDVLGIFDTSAIIVDSRRYITKLVKKEAKDSACSIELTIVEYFNSTSTLQREYTEMCIDGTVIELSESTSEITIPINDALQSVIMNFLAHKETYTDIYKKLERISELQQSFYGAEMSRSDLQETILTRAHERGLFDE